MRCAFNLDSCDEIGDGVTEIIYRPIHGLQTDSKVTNDHLTPPPKAVFSLLVHAARYPAGLHQPSKSHHLLPRLAQVGDVGLRQVETHPAGKHVCCALFEACRVGLEGGEL